MLSLTRKTDYALVAMSCLAERPEAVLSAREIAEDFGVPLPLLMNILKKLTASGLLYSVRGPRGGYGLARPAADITLAELIFALEGPFKLAQCVTCAQDDTSAGDDGVCRLEEHCPVQAPLQRVQDRLQDFLQRITLADIAGPEAVGVAQAERSDTDGR